MSDPKPLRGQQEIDRAWIADRLMAKFGMTPEHFNVKADALLTAGFTAEQVLMLFCVFKSF